MQWGHHLFTYLANTILAVDSYPHETQVHFSMLLKIIHYMEVI